ncbi:MAG: hypothetical protein WD770_08340 [Actinomycetota bacterium]
MEHVLIRKLEHLTGNAERPDLRFGIEIRDRPGPLHKHGAFEDDTVWIQLHGGLIVGRAAVRITWIGEYSDVRQVRARTAGSPIHDVEGFWAGRARYGYAGVATLTREQWVEPVWAGPRTYGYEWVRLEDDKKRASWLDPKPPPRGGDGLLASFRAWLRAG